MRKINVIYRNIRDKEGVYDPDYFDKEVIIKIGSLVLIHY